LIFKKRFDNIISFYDNDKAGLKGANYLKSNYNIKSIYIPLENKVKDFSDYCYSHTYEESKELIDKLVNENK
jgi:DNA primase